MTKWKKQPKSDFFRFEEKGDCVEGIFIGSEQSKGKYESLVYNYQDLKTKKVTAFFGSAVVDRVMLKVKPKQKFKLVYIGKVKTASGRKVKDFDIYTA